MALICPNIFIGQVGLLNNFSKPDSLLQDSIKVPDVASNDYLEFMDWEKLFEPSALKTFSKLKDAGITTGYEYGFPSDFFINRGSWGNAFVSGNLTSTQLGIPIKIQGRYRQFSLHPETENYFRLSVDVQAMKRNLIEGKSKKLNDISKLKESLTKEHQLLSRQLVSFNEKPFDNLDPAIITQVPNKYKNVDSFADVIESPFEIDSFGTTLDGKLDSLVRARNLNLTNPLEQNINSSAFVDSKLDSLKSEQENFSIAPDTIESYVTIDKKFTQLDSLDTKKAEVQNKIDALNKRLESLNKYEKIIKSGDDSLRASLNKRKILPNPEDIKTLEIGQTNPQFSRFLINSVPLNGINFGFDNSNREINFCHGQVVLAAFAPLDQRQKWIRNMVQDIIPTSKNIGDRVTAGTYSIYKSENSILRFGALYGIDKFLSNTPTDNSRGANSRSGKNIVSEISGAFKRNNATIEYAYARSVSSDEGLTIEPGTNRLINKHSNAAWLKVMYQIPRIKTDLKAEVNWIESGFRSLGNPFLRNDQGRCDLSVKKKWKSVSVSGSLRGQRNNLKGNLPISSSFYSTIFQLQGKLRKNWQATILYSPMWNVISNNQDKSSRVDRIMQLGMTSVMTWRKRDRFSVLVLSGNNYQYEGDSTSTSTSDYSGTLSIDLSDKFRSITTTKYTQTTSIDSLWAGEVKVLSQDVQFKIGKRLSLLCGSTLVLQQQETNIGMRGGFDVIICKGLNFNALFEKVALEGFYIDEILRFYNTMPYRCLVSLNYHLS